MTAAWLDWSREQGYIELPYRIQTAAKSNDQGLLIVSDKGDNRDNY